LVEREPEPKVDETIADAAEALWDETVRTRFEDEPEAAVPPRENPLAHALAYHAALPLLARDDTLGAWLGELEPQLAELDDEDRERFAPLLARAAVPALGVDVEQMKDEGYRYVAVYPPEGSEGVDIVGKAAWWLTQRMTMEGDAPRLAMRRFLAVLAESTDLPTAAATLGALLAEPMPDDPTKDRPFLALARGDRPGELGSDPWTCPGV
jgi:hypothetical protein